MVEDFYFFDVDLKPAVLVGCLTAVDVVDLLGVGCRLLLHPDPCRRVPLRTMRVKDSKRVNGYSSKQDRHFSTDAQRPGYGYTGAFRAPTGV